MVEDRLQREARLLLRAARQGTLATNDGGQPFATLITPGTAADGSVLMLLSDLSEHTRHLRADSRCSILVVGPSLQANPQTAPRVTVYGKAEIDRDPSSRARWIAQHPYANLYVGFGDFNLWRLTPEGGLIVAGFGRANRLSGQAFSSGVLVIPDEGLSTLNRDQAKAVKALTRLDQGGRDWHVVAADSDGIDLGSGENNSTRRLAFDRPVSTWSEVGPAIDRLVSSRCAKLDHNDAKR